MSLTSPIGIGSVIKIGSSHYLVEGMEVLKYTLQVTTAVAAAGSSTQRLNFLRPTSGFIYWIQTIGVNGELDFQLRFPHHKARNTPTQTDQHFWSSQDAHWLHPADISFFIPEDTEPSLFYINNQSAGRIADFVFKGLKIFGKNMEKNAMVPPPASEIIEVEDFITIAM